MEPSCTICLNLIQSYPTCKEEEGKALDCSHIFHRECIGEWLKQKHNCPLCRAPVKVDTPEAPRPEMTLEELLAVPDAVHPVEDAHFAEILAAVRATIRGTRSIRILDLNENTPVAATARKLSSLTARIFGFH